MRKLLVIILALSLALTASAIAYADTGMFKDKNGNDTENTNTVSNDASKNNENGTTGRGNLSNNDRFNQGKHPITEDIAEKAKEYAEKVKNGEMTEAQMERELKKDVSESVWLSWRSQLRRMGLFSDPNAASDPSTQLIEWNSVYKSELAEYSEKIFDIISHIVIVGEVISLAYAGLKLIAYRKPEEVAGVLKASITAIAIIMTVPMLVVGTIRMVKPYAWDPTLGNRDLITYDNRMED